MKPKKSFLPYFFAMVMSIVYAQEKYPIKHPKSYVAYRAEGLKIDGKLNEEAWEAAAWTDDFVDIEGDAKPRPQYQTRVKMLWDDNCFYIAAEMEEPHIWGTLTKRDEVIFYDNDFEVFIDPQGDNHGYYEFEINALNTVWDLLLIKPYRDGGPAIDHWDINGLLTGVEIFGTLNNPNDIDEKWTVEIAFPWNALEEWANHNGIPHNGEQWRINFSRVEWDINLTPKGYEKKKGANGKPLPEKNWVWSQQGAIAMHQPETWGYVQFSSQSVLDGQGVSFLKDEDFDLKMALMEVYLQQKAYHKKYGKFASKVNGLNLSDYNEKKYGKLITLQTTDSFFEAKAIGQKQVWHIDQTSRLWASKKQSASSRTSPK